MFITLLHTMREHTKNLMQSDKKIAPQNLTVITGLFPANHFTGLNCIPDLSGVDLVNPKGLRDLKPPAVSAAAAVARTAAPIPAIPSYRGIRYPNAVTTVSASANIITHTYILRTLIFFRCQITPWRQGACYYILCRLLCERYGACFILNA